MKSGSSNVSTTYLAGIRSRDELKTSRLGPSRDHATVVCETFHTVSEGEFCELRVYGVLRSSALLWCSDVLCALEHIHDPQTGVGCLRYVAGCGCVKAQDSYLPFQHS
jgi:hypothetical protein